MLVKFDTVRRLILATMLSFFAIFPAYADEATTTCKPTEEFYNGIATKILTFLNGGTVDGKEVKGLVSSVTEYNTLLQQTIFDENGPCYLLNTMIDSDSSQPYDWSGFDLKGASLAGEENKTQIQSLLKSMDLSKIDMDFSAYDYKNDSRISSANISIKIAQDEEKKKALLADLEKYRKCKIELFNLNQMQSNINESRSNVSLYLTTLSNPQSTNCTCDENGLKACSTVSETTEEQSAKDSSCSNLSEYAKSSSFCPTCMIFERVLMADQKLAGGSFGALSGSLVKVLGIAFLIYLAYQTLLLVSSPANQPMSKYLTTVVMQGFKVTIAVLILTNPTFLYNLALRPILEGSLDFGITLVGKGQTDIMAAGAKYTKFDTSNTLLSASLLQKMVGTAEVFNEQAALMPAMGRALVCNALTNLDWNVIPNIETLLEGVMVTVFGFMISLSVGFYLLDITLELGFFCCLLPFLIACWPFKITSRYIKTGWNIFMHIFFTFVMLGVIITTINAITKRSLAPEHDIQDLISALNDNDLGMIKELMEIGGTQFLFLIVACYICLKLLKDVNNLANKFAGGAGFNISAKLGGLAAGTVFAAGKTGGQTLLKGISSGADGLAAMSKESGVTGAVKDKAQKVSSTLGLDRMVNQMRESKGKLVSIAQQAKAGIGIGGGAKVHGGRNGTNQNDTTGDKSS